MSGNYQDLLVWQKAMDMVLKVYEVTKSFPRDSSEVGRLLNGMISHFTSSPTVGDSNLAPTPET